jgi:hypothetical protein
MMAGSGRRAPSALLVLVVLGAMGLMASAGPATAAPVRAAEVTVVHAFASVPRIAGGPTGPVVDVSIDGELVAPALAFGDAVVLAQPIAVGAHQIQVAIAGETEPIQEHDIVIPRSAAVDVAIGHSPEGGAGLPFASVFPNDLRPTPPGRTSLVLRNVSDDPSVSLYLFGPRTPKQLTAVAKGDEGGATVRAGFSELRLIPSNCAADCSVLFQQEFPAGARTIIYAAGVPGEDYDSSSFDGVNRVLDVGQHGR